MRTKALSTCFAVLLIAAGLLSGCSFEVQPVEKYRAPDGSFSLRYPLGWQVGELAEAGNAVWLSTATLGSDLGPDDMMMTFDVIAVVDHETGAPRDIPLANLLAWHLQKTEGERSGSGTRRNVSAELEPFELGEGVEAFRRMSWNPRAGNVGYSVIFPIREGVVGVASYWSSDFQNTRRHADQVYEVLRSVRVVMTAQELAAARPESRLPQFASYTSEDGFLSIEYPLELGNFMEDAPTDMGPFSGVPMAAVGNFDPNADLDFGKEMPDDGFALVVTLVPNYVPEPGMAFLKLDAEQWAQLMAAGAAQGGLGTATDIESVTLDSGALAYHTSIDNGSMLIHIYTKQIDDRVICFSMLMVSPNFDEPEQFEQALDIIDSVSFTGEVDDFIAHVEAAIDKRR